MGSIRLNGATSGYLELKAPDVSPDAVLTLPATGFGKILQVVRATDTTLRSTTSATFVDAGISVTITPEKSDSVILLIWVFRSQVDTSNTQGTHAITDSSNNVISGAEEITNYSSSGAQYIHQMAIAYATPATTSAVTYKGRWYREFGTGTPTIRNNQNTGQMFAIEVSA